VSRVDHDKTIRSRKQKIDIGKYSFVSRTIQLWSRLRADALETLSPLNQEILGSEGVGKIFQKCSEVK
jgi:hypothetical protein